VDFFTPIVDDPAVWGAIAAANALSDVYAMGGRPLFCLNLVGWPRETLSMDLLGEVMAGAARVTVRAGCPMVGGHTIDDPEPKFGLAVIGEAHPDRLLTNAGARPGDLLVLTKPIGTGILTTALKRDLVRRGPRRAIGDDTERQAAQLAWRTASVPPRTSPASACSATSTTCSAGRRHRAGVRVDSLFPRYGMCRRRVRRHQEKPGSGGCRLGPTSARRIARRGRREPPADCSSRCPPLGPGSWPRFRRASPAAAIIGRIVAEPGLQVHRTAAASWGACWIARMSERRAVERRCQVVCPSGTNTWWSPTGSDLQPRGRAGRPVPITGELIVRARRWNFHVLDA
jgi:hypothetical protein